MTEVNETKAPEEVKEPEVKKDEKPAETTTPAGEEQKPKTTAAIAFEMGVSHLENIFKAGVESYNRERVPNEINLIRLARQEMLAAGVSEAGMAVFNNSRFIKDNELSNCNVQQFNLNRFFTLQLALVKADTRLYNYMLSNDVTADVWYRLFKERFLQNFVAFGLPHPLGG